MRHAQRHQDGDQPELDAQHFEVGGPRGRIPVVGHVDDPRQDQDGEADPDQPSEAPGHLPEQVGAQQRGVHLAHDRHGDQREKQHAPDPDDRRKDMQPQVEKRQHGRERSTLRDPSQGNGRRLSRLSA